MEESRRALLQLMLEEETLKKMEMEAKAANEAKAQSFLILSQHDSVTITSWFSAYAFHQIMQRDGSKLPDLIGEVAPNLPVAVLAAVTRFVMQLKDGGFMAIQLQGKDKQIMSKEVPSPKPKLPTGKDKQIMSKEVPSPKPKLPAEKEEGEEMSEMPLLKRKRKPEPEPYHRVLECPSCRCIA